MPAQPSPPTNVSTRIPPPTSTTASTPIGVAPRGKVLIPRASPPVHTNAASASCASTNRMPQTTIVFFFFSSRRRHTRLQGDWSSDVCSSDLGREKHQGNVGEINRRLQRQADLRRKL